MLVPFTADPPPWFKSVTSKTEDSSPGLAEMQNTPKKQIRNFDSHAFSSLDRLSGHVWAEASEEST